MVLKTDRLILRNMGQEDYEALCRILKDNDVMYAYEGAFSDREVQEWLDRQTERYHQYGFGLWAVTLKDSGRMIGQCGLTMQDYREKQVLEVGYLFEKAYWHHGYAVEAAAACRDYAFNQLDAEEVYSTIRDSNTASQKVAQRNGMRYRDTIVKHYKGVTMPHHVYSVKRKTESISLCGVDCTDCEYFGTEEDRCAGCDEIQGKPFWLKYTGEEICRIYECCTYKKKLPHCGKCRRLPCPLYESSDPTKSAEENEAIFLRQMEQLKNRP